MLLSCLQLQMSEMRENNRFLSKKNLYLILREIADPYLDNSVALKCYSFFPLQSILKLRLLTDKLKVIIRKMILRYHNLELFKLVTIANSLIQCHFLFSATFVDGSSNVYSDIGSFNPVTSKSVYLYLLLQWINPF